MSSCYRLDYASTSQRNQCANCKSMLRSGEVRFTAFDTHSHLDCITSLEVLRLWQHCKNFDTIPGFTSLEMPDRLQVQQLFKTLLLSTPMQGGMKARAQKLAMMESASLMAAKQRSPPISIITSASAAAAASGLRREPSDTMMMESSPPVFASPTFSESNMSVSPDIMTHFSSSSSASASAPPPAVAFSSSHMPSATPVLRTTPSVLAQSLEKMSCATGNTPTHLAAHQPFAFHSSASSSALGSHSLPPSSSHSPALFHRPLFRDVSGSSSTSASPAVNSPASSAAFVRQSTRSVSPLDAHYMNGVGVNHQHPQSPHSNHTSPIPFAGLRVHNGTPTSSSASSSSASKMRAKRKLEDCPEEEIASSSSSSVASTAANNNMNVSMDSDSMMSDAPSLPMNSQQLQQSQQQTMEQEHLMKKRKMFDVMRNGS